MGEGERKNDRDVPIAPKDVSANPLLPEEKIMGVEAASLKRCINADAGGRYHTIVQ